MFRDLYRNILLFETFFFHSAVLVLHRVRLSGVQKAAAAMKVVYISCYLQGRIKGAHSIVSKAWFYPFKIV